MSSKGKEKEKPLASLIAGATGGAVEAFCTYPFESVKTQLQFGQLPLVNGKGSSSLFDYIPSVYGLGPHAECTSGWSSLAASESIMGFPTYHLPNAV